MERNTKVFNNNGLQQVKVFKKVPERIVTVERLSGLYFFAMHIQAFGSKWTNTGASGKINDGASIFSCILVSNFDAAVIAVAIKFVT